MMFNDQAKNTFVDCVIESLKAILGIRLIQPENQFTKTTYEKSTLNGCVTFSSSFVVRFALVLINKKIVVRHARVQSRNENVHVNISCKLRVSMNGSWIECDGEYFSAVSLA